VRDVREAGQRGRLAVTAAEHLEAALAHLRAAGVPAGEACELQVLFDARGRVRRARVDARGWPRLWSFGRRQLDVAESAGTRRIA
jgi:hypothetical protein